MIRIHVRQRTEQYCIDDTEDRSVGSNPECERDDRQKSESWILQQHSNAVSDVLCERVNHLLWPLAFVFCALLRFSGDNLGSSQYHLAVAGGCGAQETNDQASSAPTRYREVVLTSSKIGPPKQMGHSCHSYLSATNGSTFVARRAGK